MLRKVVAILSMLLAVPILILGGEFLYLERP
jgi:hypothetical protein